MRSQELFTHGPDSPTPCLLEASLSLTVLGFGDDLSVQMSEVVSAGPIPTPGLLSAMARWVMFWGGGVLLQVQTLDGCDVPLSDS